jgi:hypothetical protein
MMAGKPLRISLRNFIYSCGSDYRISFRGFPRYDPTYLVVQAAITLAPCHPIGLPSQSKSVYSRQFLLFYLLVDDTSGQNHQLFSAPVKLLAIRYQLIFYNRKTPFAHL